MGTGVCTGWLGFAGGTKCGAGVGVAQPCALLVGREGLLREGGGCRHASWSVPLCPMLCCAVLFCAVLCCAVYLQACQAMLFCSVLCYAARQAGRQAASD